MNNDKDRKYRAIVIVTLIIGIITLPISFASVSRMLFISGATTIRGSTWKISFANLSTPAIVGDASIDTTATLSSTTINFAVSLRQPGDSVTYTFDVINNGTIDAKVSAVSLSGISLASANDVTYTLTYANGVEIKPNDPLPASTSKALKMVIKYDSGASSALSTDVQLNLGATINYVQD